MCLSGKLSRGVLGDDCSNAYVHTVRKDKERVVTLNVVCRKQNGGPVVRTSRRNMKLM